MQRAGLSFKRSPWQGEQEGQTNVRAVKDVLALLGLLLVAWVALAMCEALGLIGPAIGGH
jgi:hypothetical protein